MEFTTAQATAAPIDFTLRGKTYRLSPLRDADYGELEAWLRQDYLATVKAGAADLEPAERQRQLDRAFDRAHLITYTSAEGLERMNSLPGRGKTIWLCLRRNHPELTEADVLDLLADPDAMQAAMDALTAQVEAHSPTAPRRPTTRTRKRRR